VIKWPFALINHEAAKQKWREKSPASVQRGAIGLVPEWFVIVFVHPSRERRAP
jgi:hypothetical protein